MARNQQRRSVETLQYYEFFHSNVCHICKKSTNLRECPSCHMIYYCNEQHRIDHEAEHQDICEAIVKLDKQRKVWNSRVMTLEAWVKFKKENVKSIEQILCRFLEPDEKQMFMFAKSCFICHRQDDVYDLCKQCSSINVCSDHNLTDAVHACSQLQRALVLDRFNFDKVERSKGIWKGHMSTHKYVVLDMESFITKIVQHSRTTVKWTNHDYILTDDFSGPLTLYYMIKRIPLVQKGDSFVIHIINGKMMDNRSLLAWELVLHEFCRGTTLTLVMIGPELDDEYCCMDTCLSCDRLAKKFKYKCHKMMYHTCDKRCELFGPPDVIIMFDVELKYEEASTEIIKACQRQRCPVLLTAKSKIKADDNVMMIRKILDLPIDPLFNEKNKFRSFKPYRNYEDDSVFYPNEYLIFYQNLYDLTRSAQNSSSSGV